MLIGDAAHPTLPFLAQGGYSSTAGSLAGPRRPARLNTFSLVPPISARAP